MAVELTAGSHAARIEANEVEPIADLFREDERAYLMQEANGRATRPAAVDHQHADAPRGVRCWQPGYRQASVSPAGCA